MHTWKVGFSAAPKWHLVSTSLFMIATVECLFIYLFSRKRREKDLIWLLCCWRIIAVFGWSVPFTEVQRTWRTRQQPQKIICWRSQWMEESGIFKGLSWFNFNAKSHSLHRFNWKLKLKAVAKLGCRQSAFQFSPCNDAAQMQHWGFMRKNAQNEKLLPESTSFAASLYFLCRFFFHFRSVTTLENRNSFYKQHSAPVCDIIVRETSLLWLLFLEKNKSRVYWRARIDSLAETIRVLKRPRVNKHERWVFSINKKKMKAPGCLMGSCGSSVWSGSKENTSSQVDMMNR